MMKIYFILLKFVRVKIHSFIRSLCLFRIELNKNLSALVPKISKVTASSSSKTASY